MRRCGSSRTDCGISRGSQPPVRCGRCATRVWRTHRADRWLFLSRWGGPLSVPVRDRRVRIRRDRPCGVFDDVQQAATAWRALLGDTAENARPEWVETAERLLCLVHCDSG